MQMMSSSSLTVLGATTCEDTALVRSRLRSLGVPFEERDIDLDAAAGDELSRLHDGSLITPTLLFGGDTGGRVLTEPTVGELDRALREAAVGGQPPSIERLYGDVAARPIPFRSLPTPEGDRVSIETLRGRRQMALFLAHGPACLACFGYAKQLAGMRRAIEEANAVPFVVAPGDLARFATWRHEIGPDLAIGIDLDGEWSREVLASIGRPPGVALVILDQFAAPRAASVAPEAGGLADPAEAAEWLAFVALDCPECSVELPWPEPGTG